MFALTFMLGVSVLFVQITTTTGLTTSFAPKRVATVPVGLFMLSATLSSFPINAFMARFGRRLGVVPATVCGAGGALCCFGGAIEKSLALVIVGSMLQGVLFTYVLSLRFAAAAITPPALRPRAMSFVVGGAAISGVLAREFSVHGRLWLPVAEFAGPYVIIVIVCAAMLALISAVDFTPVAMPQPVVAPEDAAKVERKPLVELVTTPHFYVSAISTAVTYASMASLMAATPARMLNLGYDLTVGADVVQYHVAAMYAPCIFTGDVIKAAGAPLVILLGYSVMIVAAVVYSLGNVFGVYVAAMVLLGIGWNFAFLGSTALLAQGFAGPDAQRVQGMNDTIALGLLSVGITTASIVLEDVSWEALLWIHLSLMVLGMCAVSSYVLPQTARRHGCCGGSRANSSAGASSSRA
mmetsp:Transcript_15259/g.46576  ORF Transcript_15259/g.46576 Transcript_15259/m.46576 type:complete len:410 (-) Transcript_15259:162-1391(-)